MIAELLLHAQEFITAAMDRKRALTSDMLTRVFSELDDDDDGELGPRVFCSALQVRHGFTPACRPDVTCAVTVVKRHENTLCYIRHVWILIGVHAGVSRCQLMGRL